MFRLSDALLYHPYPYLIARRVVYSDVAVELPMHWLCRAGHLCLSKYGYYQ